MPMFPKARFEAIRPASSSWEAHNTPIRRRAQHLPTKITTSTPSKGLLNQFLRSFPHLPQSPGLTVTLSWTPPAHFPAGLLLVIHQAQRLVTLHHL